MRPTFWTIWDAARRQLSIGLVRLAIAARPYKSDADVDFFAYCRDMIEVELLHAQSLAELGVQHPDPIDR